MLKMQDQDETLVKGRPPKKEDLNDILRLGIIMRSRSFLIVISICSVLLSTPLYPNQVLTYSESELVSGFFGNRQVGDEFIHNLNSDMWGSFFTCPESGYAKDISVYVKTREESHLRCALYEEYVHTLPPPHTKKYMRFIMSTEGRIVPQSFEGWVTLEFTAPPPIHKDIVYWICAWSDEYSSIRISTSEGGVGIEWTVTMLGDPHGLGYPRFYETVPQYRRTSILCSIYCTYDAEAPTIHKCPYCGIQYQNYETVLEHIKSTPEEMIHLQICNECGRIFYLKEELQQHLYEYHQVGSAPEYYSCIFCDFKSSTAEEVYTHINNTHQPELDDEPIIPEFTSIILPFTIILLVTLILKRKYLNTKNIRTY
jgi:hypothetical protein